MALVLSGKVLFVAVEVVASLVLAYSLQRCEQECFALPSLSDVIHVRKSGPPWLALALVIGPFLSLLYIRASAACSKPGASPTAPKDEIVEGTADPYVIAGIHFGHYAFVYTPVLTGLLCIAHIDTIRARLLGPAELVPLAFFALTWGYHHAIVEHDVKGWQFQWQQAEKDTVLFRRTLNGLMMGSAIHHTCIAVATLDQPLWALLCAATCMNLYKPAWMDDKSIAVSMMAVMVISAAGLYGSLALYNGSYGAVLVFLLGMTTQPGIDKLQETGDQRWHLLEACQAFIMVGLQHALVLRSLT